MNPHGARLRKLVAAGGPVVVPGVFAPLVGRLAAEAGFQAVYLTGAGVAGGAYGLPDLGVVTQTELVDVARRTVEACGLPLICDADTGFGGVLNVRRTVRDLEAAGVAALHLEDQQFPRRCGFLGGHELVAADEMVVRLRVALEARRSEDTMIIARTEMFGASGLDETIERANRYLEAGADMVFCNGVTTETQAERLARAIPGPQIYNVSTSGLSPHLGTDRLRELGYRVVIFPAHALFLALRQIQAMFADLHQHGTLAPWLDRMVDFNEWKRLSGIRESEALEQRYAVGGQE
ncbi:MAG: isocitrate lyase/PEP mutase family protein [Rubrivivax sp.]